MFDKWFRITEISLKSALKNVVKFALEEIEDLDEIATIVAYSSLHFALKSQLIGGSGSEELRVLCNETIDGLITEDEDILAYFKTTGKKQ